MRYYVCNVAVAPIRNNPDHRAEMVSQLIFGEFASITFTEKAWCKIEAKADGYSGWCLLSQVQEISGASYDASNCLLAAEWVNEIILNGNRMMIPFGSSISGYNGDTGWLSHSLQYKGQIWNTNEVRASEKTINQLAFKFLNTPYLWGGRTVFGTDCSGFTQMVYNFLNISLKRDAHLQASQGELVEFLQQAQCGDLAFFDDEEGSIIHVGILLNAAEIIHAAGKVRVDKIDHQGIINGETGQRMQTLRLIKRFF